MPVTNDAGSNHFIGIAYTVALLAGHIRLLTGIADKVDICDQYASAPVDAERRSAGVKFSSLDVARAEAACRVAHREHSNDAHYTFLLGRVLLDKSESDDLIYESAKAGYAAAFNGMTFMIDHSSPYLEERTSGPLHEWAHDAARRYTQRTVLGAFSATFEFLKNHTRSDEEKATLRWFAEFAARFGSADAHLALAELSAIDSEKWFHLRLAARLEEEGGHHDEAVALRTRVDGIRLPRSELEEQEDRVQRWQPEVLKELPPDILQKLRKR